MIAENTFDLIIVGGGRADLVLANRLSSNKHRHVLVLEARQNRNSDPKIGIPDYVTQSFGDPDYD